MFLQTEEGKWFLEDLSGTIPLNFQHAESPDVLVTEGCIVAVEGRGTSTMFEVHVSVEGFRCFYFYNHCLAYHVFPC